MKKQQQRKHPRQRATTETDAASSPTAPTTGGDHHHHPFILERKDNRNPAQGYVRTDPSQINLLDPPYELIIMFDLDDPRLANRGRSTLFHTLQAMLGGSQLAPDQHSNLERLLGYYNTTRDRRRPLQPKHPSLAGYIRATHILLYWNAITKEARRPLKENPLDVFSVPHFDSGLDCFMLYERADNYVHLLNWNVRHTVVRTEDHTKQFIDGVNYIKRLYIDPTLNVQFMRVDVYPFLESLVLFGVELGFEVEYEDLARNEPSRTERTMLILHFRQVMRNPTRRELRAILREPRYRTQLPNGDSVLRLYYRATICTCTLSITANTTGQVRSGQCSQCGEVYYCSDACRQWTRCCDEEEEQ